MKEKRVVVAALCYNELLQNEISQYLCRYFICVD